MSSPIFDATFGTGRFKGEEPMKTDPTTSPSPEPQDVRQKLLGALERRRFADEGGRYLLTQSQAFDAFVEVLSAFPALAQSDAKPDASAGLIEAAEWLTEHAKKLRGRIGADNLSHLVANEIDYSAAYIRSRAADRSGPRSVASAGLIEGLEEAARTAEQTYVEPVFEEETDHNGIYTGKVDLVRKTFFKWRDGPAIAKAIRARAADRSGK